MYKINPAVPNLTHSKVDGPNPSNAVLANVGIEPEAKAFNRTKPNPRLRKPFTLDKIKSIFIRLFQICAYGLQVY